MVAQDGVIVRVWVFTSRIWGIPLEGCIVGAGHAWCWHGVTTAWVIGGFTVVAGHGARRSHYWWVTCDFADAGFMEGVHMFGGGE